MFSLSREDFFFKNHTSKDEAEKTRFLTDFTRHSDKVRNILTCHWPILTNDNVIKKHIHSRPQSRFPQAPSLKDKLVHSHFSQVQSEQVIDQDKGTFCYNECPECFVIRNVGTFRLPNGKNFYPKQRITCKRKGVIYFMTCCCICFYIGKKKGFSTKESTNIFIWSKKARLLYPFM